MRGLLFSEMTPPPGERAEFDEWYDDDHIPVRIVLDGFERATRYAAIGDEIEHLVCYLLDDLAVLDSPEYHVVKTEPSDRTRYMLDAVSDFSRYTAAALGDTGSAPPPATTLVVTVDASGRPDGDDVVGAWIDAELVDATRSLQGWSRTHWYRTLGSWVGPTRTHFVVVDLADTAAVASNVDLPAALTETLGRAPGPIETLRYRSIISRP